MNILLIDKFSNKEIKQTEAIPQIGSYVCWRFYDPSPIVKHVLMYPTKLKLSQVSFNLEVKIEAIVYLS